MAHWIDIFHNGFPTVPFFCNGTLVTKKEILGQGRATFFGCGPDERSGNGPRAGA